LILGALIYVADMLQERFATTCLWRCWRRSSTKTWRKRSRTWKCDSWSPIHSE